ncbi:MAG: acetyl-CoA carboxylase biotin carboxyl carrier protein [Verrucomicrobiae bacterium]|nr:acetyl-CoA carboxylase biotin carboxyl carrier protein [Verrucomicrobiae bacterium]
MEFKEIKSIVELMTKNGLTEFEFEKDNVKIRIKRGSDDSAAVVTTLSGETNGNGTHQVVIPVAAPVPQLAAPAAAPAAPAPEAINSKEIKAPMVGTFYRAPSPDSPPYVEVGKVVTEETVVCIIEAMKVMNEIKAEMKGVITEVLIENGKPVEFGKPMFRVKA